eukprot:1143883-Pelagomonas_calceolata.AAC.6
MLTYLQSPCCATSCHDPQGQSLNSPGIWIVTCPRRRYYRVMATGVYRRAADAEYAARAFRAVAQAWFEMRAEACVAAASVCALDVMALGGMW